MNYEFPQEMNILHDCLDPEQKDAQVGVVYPILLDLMDQAANINGHKRLTPRNPPQPRKFLAMGLGLTGAAIGGPTAIYFGNEANQISIERQIIPSKNLPQGWKVLKLPISDIHLGPLTKSSWCNKPCA